MSSTLAFPVKTLTPTDSLVGFQGTTPGDERTFVPGAAGALVFSGTTAAAIRSTLELGSLATQSGTFSGTSSGTNTGDQNLSGLLVKASNLSDLTDTTTARTNLGLGSLATQSGTFSGTSSGTNTGDQTSVSGNAGTANVLATARMINGVSFNGSANITVPAAGSTLTDTVTVAKGGTGATTLTANNVLLGNGTSALQVVAPSTAGNVLRSDGTTWTSAAIQLGDRYLTSSTTSNTVSNGAKTFTVGTGLAYTPTQDITIVFNASNHMHCSVTSYNSGTGVLVVDVNSHTGSGTYTAWTVNVGGIGAGAIPSGGTAGQVLAKVSPADYDDAWVTLGTAATRNVGQAAGNVLDVSQFESFTLTTSDDGFIDTAFVWNPAIGGYSSQDHQLYIEGGQWLVSSSGGELYRSSAIVSETNPSANIDWATANDYGGGSGIPITFTFSRNAYSVSRLGDFSGFALTSQLPTLGTGVATALAVNLGTTGSAALRLISSDTTPASPNAMDEWYDSATGARYVRYGSVWVETSGSTIGNALATATSAGMVSGIGGTVLTNATDYLSLAYRHRVIPVTSQTWTNAGTGTGSVGGEPGAMRYGGSTGVTTLSTLRFYLNNVGNSLQGALHDVNSNSTLNFSARWAFTFQFFTDSQHANATTYFMLGIAVGTAYGAPTTKSVGLRVVNGTGVGFAHDGTTLNVSSTIGTFSGFVSNVLTIENMGTGTVNFYLNGVLSVTMTNGPTGMSATSGETFVVAFTNGATATSNRAFILSASALRMN